MVRNSSHSSRSMEPSEVDNLQHIKGIGPVVERRLNSVGIFSFMQLSALSPADIAALVADLHGLSAENIIKQDWIGQAHTLASREPATISMAKTDLSVPAVLTKSNLDTGIDLAKPVKGKTGLTGDLQLNELKIITTNGFNQSGLLRSNEPFTLEITVDTTHIMLPPNAKTSYKAYLYGKYLEDGTHQKIGEAQGIIQSHGFIKVKMEVTVVSPGLYHLEVIVGVNHCPEDGRPPLIPDLIACAEVRPLYFY